MNVFSKEPLSSITYALSAHKIWLGLKEAFDIVNGFKVFYLHREIVTLTQGTLLIFEYFSRMRNMWKNMMDEFDALMPCLGCNCLKSQNYAQHHGYRRVPRFLMGLNICTM